MPSIVKDLLLSKKFVVALLTIGGSVAAYKGWNVDPMTILPFISPALVYIGAQGWADNGKEKAKIDGATALQIHTQAMQLGAVPRPAPAPQNDDKPSVTVNVTNSEAPK